MTLVKLPVRTTPDREFLGAIVDLLVEQNVMLSQVLATLTPGAEQVAPGGLVEVSDTPPALASDATPTLLALTGEARPTPPPTSGPGSGRKAWAAYATACGVQIDDSWSRERITQACVEASTQAS